MTGSFLNPQITMRSISHIVSILARSVIYSDLLLLYVLPVHLCDDELARPLLKTRNVYEHVYSPER